MKANTSTRSYSNTSRLTQLGRPRKSQYKSDCFAILCTPVENVLHNKTFTSVRTKKKFLQNFVTNQTWFDYINQRLRFRKEKC